MSDQFPLLPRVGLNPLFSVQVICNEIHMTTHKVNNTKCKKKGKESAHVDHLQTPLQLLTSNNAILYAF